MINDATMQERSRVPALLATGLCVAVSLLNWQLLTMEIDISPIASDAAIGALPLDPADGLQPESSVAEAATFPETLARPLFRADRRPPEAGKSNTALPASIKAPRRVAELPDDLELVGIMKEAGRAERALIRSGGSPAGQWFEVGHVLNGWRLSRIESSGIVFEAQGQQQKLTLFPDKAE